jgi:hypothetical protein
LSTLTACCYAFDQKIVCLALDSFKELVKAKAAIPAPLLNHFLQCVCDACPCFLGHFASNNRAFVLKFLLFTFKEFLPLLEMQTVLKMMEACVLMRHEDKKLMISKHMLDHLITLTTRCLPCPSTNHGNSPVRFPYPPLQHTAFHARVLDCSFPAARVGWP